MTNKKFVIIDALALAYKAYFAFINRPLSNSKGEATSAVYGFLTQLIKVLEIEKPDYLAVAFDSKKKLLDMKSMNCINHPARLCPKI